MPEIIRYQPSQVAVSIETAQIDRKILVGHHHSVKLLIIIPVV